jgi:carbon-monoxide dehydrogenase iron sulfur subunit
MKTVVIHPERCVGCMQCSVACAVTHSKSKNLYGAIFERPLTPPRIHVGSGPAAFAFPNKCRHCNPAPCMRACMPRAIVRDAVTEAVLVDPGRCINCGMCAMACPFGVIRYAADWRTPAVKAVAVKCDNCVERQKEGVEPACVETCKVGALEFADLNDVLRAQSSALAREVSVGLRQEGSAAVEAAVTATSAATLWRALAEAADTVKPQ